MRIPVFTYGAVQNIAAGEFDRERPHAEVSGTPEYWPGFRCAAFLLRWKGAVERGCCSSPRAPSVVERNALVSAPIVRM